VSLSFKDIVTVSMILFAVIDIIGSIPVLIQIRKQAGSIHSERATIVSLCIMVMFLFLGENLLKFLGLDLSSFAIAGSLVLFIIALEMILGIRIHKDDMPSSASIVPVAFPLIAGTGTMTTLLSLRAEYDTVTIIIGILLNLIVVYICLKNLGFLEKLLGPVGIAVVRKVFGFILLAIAVKLFRTHMGV
jgi:multiple antibiotic resistance protein